MGATSAAKAATEMPPARSEQLSLKARRTERLHVECGVGDVVRWQFSIEKYDFKLTIAFRPELISSTSSHGTLPITADTLIGDPENATTGGKYYGAYLSTSPGFVTFDLDNTVRAPRWLPPTSVHRAVVSPPSLQPPAVPAPSATSSRMTAWRRAFEPNI